jgi:hypothetical protein
MADTQTLILWREYHATTSRMQRAWWAAAERDFKPGMRVKWLHSAGHGARPDAYREGVVDRVSFGQLIVRMRVGGPTHRVDAYLAEVMEPAPGVPEARHQTKPPADPDGGERKAGT